MPTRGVKPRRRLRLAALTVLLAGVIPAVPLIGAAPAQADAGISQRRGLDVCGIGSPANTQAFWTNTPYFNLGVYLGGSDLDPGCTRLTASWISEVKAQGWRFMLIWVGPQPPCSSEPSRFSSNPTTAAQQGRDEAVKIYNRLIELGIPTLDTPVIYDFEPFPQNNTSCMDAAKSFMNAFRQQMELPPRQNTGLYGSTCASGLAQFATIANPPVFITGAKWDDDPNTSNLGPCVGSGLWTFSQRHKQYTGDRIETRNGVTLRIDHDCSNALVWPGPDALDVGQGCV